MTTIKTGKIKLRGENPNISSNWSRCHQSDVAHEIRQHFVGNAAMSEVASHQIPRWSPKCPYEAKTPSRFPPEPVKNIREGIWTRWARCVKKLSQTTGRHHEYITDWDTPWCHAVCSNALTKIYQSQLTLCPKRWAVQCVEIQNKSYKNDTESIKIKKLNPYIHRRLYFI